jgi:hypothetical protein
LAEKAIVLLEKLNWYHRACLMLCHVFRQDNVGIDSYTHWEYDINNPKLCTSRRGEVLKPLVALRKVILNHSKGDF